MEVRRGAIEGIMVKMPAATTFITYRTSFGFGQRNRDAKIGVVSHSGGHQIGHDVEADRASSARSTVTRFFPEDSCALIQLAWASEHVLVSSMISRAVMVS